MLRHIDAHIHLDKYESGIQHAMLSELEDCGILGVVAVSMNLASCRDNHRLQLRFPRQVFPAYGFHPEQELIAEEELDQLFAWIRAHQDGMAAVGEVGLPYYERKQAEAEGRGFELDPYIRLLDRFIALAAELKKPVVLHAVYEDAKTACDLLEKHNVRNAHFHWFKGDEETVRRMAQNGYYVSFTPDIAYEAEIRELAARYPLEQMMAETDGPWPFEGPFQGRQTHPRMISSVVGEIAGIKGISEKAAAETILQNTKRFYHI
ncbi:TatD family hydrolase [Brevibacillus sp. B_LB10_24]|uniref:TatD family hydrolase n=1 Tax=Brevibacillus sp. B_LB10_24 TaxID=3380645 RepID=UPI0038B85FF3